MNDERIDGEQKTRRAEEHVKSGSPHRNEHLSLPSTESYGFSTTPEKDYALGYRMNQEDHRTTKN
jgi:hypothetical protein